MELKKAGPSLAACAPKTQIERDEANSRLHDLECTYVPSDKDAEKFHKRCSTGTGYSPVLSLSLNSDSSSWTTRPKEAVELKRLDETITVNLAGKDAQPSELEITLTLHKPAQLPPEKLGSGCINHFNGELDDQDKTTIQSELTKELRKFPVQGLNINDFLQDIGISQNLVALIHTNLFAGYSTAAKEVKVNILVQKDIEVTLKHQKMTATAATRSTVPFYHVFVLKRLGFELPSETNAELEKEIEQGIKDLDNFQEHKKTIKTRFLTAFKTCLSPKVEDTVNS